MTFDEVADLVGAETAAELRRITLEVYRRGRRRWPPSAASSWRTPSWSSAGRRTATLVLADEVLTPDSSRFWPADDYSPGRPQHSFDKQYLRDWSTVDRLGPHSARAGDPADMVGGVTARYAELFDRLTAGQEL